MRRFFPPVLLLSLIDLRAELLDLLLSVLQHAHERFDCLSLLRVHTDQAVTLHTQAILGCDRWLVCRLHNLHAHLVNGLHGLCAADHLLLHLSVDK